MKIGAGGAVKTTGSAVSASTKRGQKDAKKDTQHDANAMTTSTDSAAKGGKHRGRSSSKGGKGKKSSSSRRLSLRQSLDMYRESGLGMVQEASVEEESEDEGESAVNLDTHTEDEVNLSGGWTQGELDRAADALKRASLGSTGGIGEGTSDLSVLDSSAGEFLSLGGDCSMGLGCNWTLSDS